MHSLDIHTIFNLIVVEMKYVLSRLCNMLENFFFLIFFYIKGEFLRLSVVKFGSSANCFVSFI